MGYSKSYNNQTGITYVYETIESHYDKDKKRTILKRKLIGKLDPETGEIIPTGNRGRPRKTSTVPDPDYKLLYSQAQKKINEYESRIQYLEDLLHRYTEATSNELDKIRQAASFLKDIKNEEFKILEEIAAE